MKETTCCFTGHRVIGPAKLPSIKAELKKEITALIAKGVNTFWAGGAMGFDTIAAEMISEFKKDFPEIKLMVAIPCRDQTAKWRDDLKKRYDKIIEKCDGYVILAEEYYSGCMQVRNRFMVDNSAYCITYITTEYGGTAYTVNYAERKGVTVIKLFEDKQGEQLALPF